MGFSRLLAIFLPCFAYAQVDLHAHLSLKPGVGVLFHGSFADEPFAHDWKSTHESKATQKSFDRPLSPLIVVSLYAHPLLAYTEVSGESLFNPKGIVSRGLELEYQEIVAWAKTHSDRFGLARNAKEAEQLIAQHKTALVLSIEGAYGALENEDDFKKWIDERGVAIVTPFHLTEDHFGGVALLGRTRVVNSPFEFLKSLLLTGLSCLKTFCKGTSGITPEGVALIDKLIQRKVWVDASHANDMELIELLPIFESKKLPLLVTHSQLRDFYKAERGLSESEIQYLQKRDGVIGLLPTQEFFDRWPEPQSKCESGLEAFKQSVAVAAKILGPEKVVLGSDINSPLNGLSPACDPQTDFAKKGFYQYSQWPELYAYITPPPLKGDAWNALTLRHFLKLWKQIR